MSLKGFPSVKVDQARKYKDLELENTRLKKLVADLSLREVMLKEVIKGNFYLCERLISWRITLKE